MEISLAELILVVAAAVGFYRMLRPLQERLEAWLLRLLDPGRGEIIDAEVFEAKKRKTDKE